MSRYVTTSISFCFKMPIRSFRNAIESKFAFGRCSMMVGGVLRIGSSVGVIVGVKVGGGIVVRVGRGVIVELSEITGMVISVTGIGVACGVGAQAEIARSDNKIVIASDFMGVPPVQD